MDDARLTALEDGFAFLLAFIANAFGRDQGLTAADVAHGLGEAMVNSGRDDAGRLSALAAAAVDLAQRLDAERAQGLGRH